MTNQDNIVSELQKIRDDAIRVQCMLDMLKNSHWEITGCTISEYDTLIRLFRDTRNLCNSIVTITEQK